MKKQKLGEIPKITGFFWFLGTLPKDWQGVIFQCCKECPFLQVEEGADAEEGEEEQAEEDEIVEGDPVIELTELTGWGETSKSPKNPKDADGEMIILVG